MNFSKNHGAICLASSFLFFFSTGFSQTSQQCMDLGTGIEVSNGEYALIDFFKNGGRWEPIGDNGHPWYKVYSFDTFKVVNGSYWHWDADWSNTINNEQWGEDWADCYISYYDMMFDQGLMRPDGYPAQFPCIVYKYRPSTQDPNQSIDPSRPVQITQFTRRIYFPRGLPADGWVLKWEGTGTIHFEGIEIIDDSGVESSQNLGNSWYPEGYSYSGQDWRFVSEGGGRVVTRHFWMIHGWVLYIEESDPDDPIRNIQFIFPGLEDEYDAGQRFHPLFLERIAQFSSIRYMGFNNGNNIEARTGVSPDNPFHDNYYVDWLRWNERTPENWYQLNNGNGGNYEYIIELSNLTQTDPWVCIPYCAGETYCDSLIDLFMERLDPDLTLYLEMGNEMWNFGADFNGFFWQAAKRVTEYPGLGDVEARGAFINQMFGRITHRLSERNLARIKRVYGSFPRYGDVNNRTLEMIDIDHWDMFATTWYFGLNNDNTEDNSCLDPVSGNNWRSVLYNWWVAHPTDQAGFNQQYRNCLLNEFRCGGGYRNNIDVQMANYYGKEIVCYEGGNHTFYGCTNAPDGAYPLEGPEELNFDDPVYPNYITNHGFINAVCVADESEEMAEVYDEVLDSLQSAGYRLSNHLSFVGGSSCYGVWSLIQDRDVNAPLATLLNNYPKFRLFSERVASDNCELAEIILDSSSVGPGLSILLDGIDDYVEGQTAYVPNEASNYSVETWFNALYTDRDQTIVSFSNSGTNNNYNLLKTRADRRIVWEIGNNSTNVMRLIGPAIETNRWYHAAIVKNGQRYILYLNGVNVASANYSLSTYTRNLFTIGALQTNTGVSGEFSGNIDEVRLWNIARTESDVREYMCKKITPSVPSFANLRSYYRFDHPDYSTFRVLDHATNTLTGQLHNISITVRSRYAISGAAIGDYSRYRYTGSWSGVSLSLADPDGDMLAVSNMGQGNPDGVHLYIIEGESHYNTPPGPYEGISDERAFGVFMANGTLPNYDITYVYSGNPDALTGDAEADHRLLRRDMYSTEEWLHAGARLDLVANAMTLACKETLRGEYTLAFRHEENVDRPGSGIALLNNQAPTGEIEGLVQYLDLTDYTVTFWARGWGNVYNFTDRYGNNSEWFAIDPAWQTGLNCGIRHIYDWASQYVSSPSYSGERNEWYHYAITHQGTRITIYINGIQIAAGDVTTPFPIREMHLLNDPSWQVGNFPGGVANLAIDELSVWNVAIDQTTIRDWMCKKITEEHPYECENLVLYFNFDENQGSVLEDKRGPSDIRLLTNSGGFQWISSGAAVGDESVHDYSTPQDITFTHPDGDYLEAIRTSGSSTGIQLYRVDHMPPVPTTTSSATIVSMDSTRYWGMYSIEPYGVTNAYTVINHYENNSQVDLTHESELRLLSRTDNSVAPWSANIGVLPNTTANTHTLTNQLRGEYILGGTSTSTFHDYVAPDQPVFIPESTNVNSDTACGNSTGLIYRVYHDPSVETYIWTIPPGLDGFSTGDSIVLNASYNGSAPVQLTISVVAVNAYGESPAATYIIVLLPPPTYADAGPDQLLIPPAASTVMDGNTPQSYETGIWTRSTGTGTIQEDNNPLTAVNGLGVGYNSFRWTIDNLVCPPSIDSMQILVAPPPTNIILTNGDPLPYIICSGEILNLRVIPAEDVPNNGYQWGMPGGLTLLSQSDDVATVQAGNGIGGPIRVAAIYGTSYSEYFESHPVNINALPNPPVFIEAPDVLCLDVDIMVEAQLDATVDSFVWTLPYGVYPVDYPKSTSESIEIQAIFEVSGWIFVQTYNDRCTRPSAIDSFQFTVQHAPEIPELYLGTNGGTADQFCGENYALLWVRDPDEDITYEWTWDVYTEQVEYFGDNHYGALFTMPDRNNEIYVRAVEGTGACSASEWFQYNGWTQDVDPSVINSVTITTPAGQDPLDLQVGQTYTFTVNGTGDHYFWDVPDGYELINDGDINDEVNRIRVLNEAAGYLDIYSITLRGCSSPEFRMNISTPNGVLPPEFVSGTAIICQGSNLNITVTNVGASQYIWTLPDNTTYTTATTTLNQQINTPMSGIMTVIARQGGVNSPALEIEIEVRATILQAVGFVDEDNNPIEEFELCNGDNGRPVYHRNAFANSYIWAIHGSAMEFNPRYEPGHEEDDNYELLNRTSPVDTMLSVNWVDWRCRNDGTDGGYIVVTATNVCGGPNITDSVYYYWAQPLSVLVPEFTEAPTELCVGSTANYEIEPIPGANQYIWQLPNGLVASDIVTTIPSITTDIVNGTGGILSVYATGDVCGGSHTIPQTTQPIHISGDAIDFYFIDEPLAACPGDELTYSVNDIGADEYLWSLPLGLGSLQKDDSDADIVRIGTWNEEIRENMVNGHYREAENNQVRSLEYIPAIEYPGIYRVSLSFFNTWGTTAVMPVTIHHANGIDIQYVNLQGEPENGIWHVLGDYEFINGTSGSVTIATTTGGGGRSIADAVRFEILSIADDTSITLTANSNGGGAVCVSVMVPQCASLYTLCTDPVNLGGTLETPVFIVQENSVCEGMEYTYRLNDIGADTYTWYLPAGMSIDGSTGTVNGLGREVTITMNTEQATPVQVGVRGVINSCSVESELVYTEDIEFDGVGCALTNPMFMNQPDTICLGSTATYSAGIVLNADTYQWVLPAGLRQTLTLATGTITTTTPSIIVEPTGTPLGSLGVITVTAQSTTLDNSDPVSTDDPVVVVETPSFTVLATDISTCGADDGTIALNGLDASTIYSIRYSRDGTTVGPSNMTSNSAGSVLINALEQGIYTNIVVNPGTCNAVNSNTYTMTDPSTIEITDIEFVSADLCGSSGTITITLDGAADGDTYDIDFSSDGSNDTVGTVEGGIIEINGIDEEIAVNGMLITNTVSGCTGTSIENGTIHIAQSVVIRDVIYTNALQCGGVGTIEIVLTGSTEGEPYDIDYNNDGTVDDTGSVSGGIIILDDIEIGVSITDLSIYNTITRCISVSSDTGTIHGPALQTITDVVYTSPAECDQGGTIEILLTGGVDGDVYAIDYNRDLTIDATDTLVSGSILITGILTNLTVNSLIIANTESLCRSENTDVGSIVIPEPAAIAGALFTQPATCAAQGRIDIMLSGSNNGDTYSIDYNDDGTEDNTGTVQNDTITLNNIDAGTEVSDLVITQTGNHCISNSAVTGIITDPFGVEITAVEFNDADTCGGTGSVMIHLTGSTDGDIYNIDLSSKGAIDAIDTVIGGMISVTGLPDGTAINGITITLDESTCTVETNETGTIHVPQPPMITNVRFTDAQVCEGTGQIEITLTVTQEGDVYDIDYNNDGTTDNTGTVNGGIILLNASIETAVTDLHITNSSSGCTSESTDTGIIAGPLPVVISDVIYINPLQCEGTGSIEIVLETATAGEVYGVDYTSDGVNDNIGTVAGNSVTLTNLLAGVSVTELTITNTTTQCISTSTDGGTMIDPSGVEITLVQLTDAVRCGGEGTMTLQLTGTAEGDNYDVDYNNDGTTDNSGTVAAGNLVITGLPAGTEITDLVIIQTDNYCRTHSDYTGIVNEPPLPQVIMTDIAPLCADDELYPLTGGQPEGGNYLVNGQAMTVIDPQTLGAGTHELVYQYTDANNCTGDTSIEFVVHELPDADITGETLVCPEETDLVYSAIYDAENNYLWSVEGGDYAQGENQAQIVADWSEIIQGVVSVSVTNQATTCSDSATLIVEFGDDGGPVIEECDSLVTVTVLLDNAGWYYIFSSADNDIIPTAIDSCDDELTVTFAVNDGNERNISDFSGTRVEANRNTSIHWRVYDAGNNSAECTSRIEFDIEELIPSAFSPNNDGANDVWDIAFLTQYPESRIKVYDRNGNLVFESEQGYPEPWDGKCKGRVLPTDSYHFILYLQEGRIPIKGIVTIIR